MYKMEFNDRINHGYCCDNYIYNCREVKQVPVFEAYDKTAKLGIMYAGTAEYSDLLFSSKYQRLLVKNLLNSSKTVAK